MLFKNFLSVIPILIGVLVGYALSFVMGVVDTTPIAEAHWFALPTFYTPRFEWFAIFTILPAALVVIAEHVGHLVVTANIVKRDLIRDPACIVRCLPATICRRSFPASSVRRPTLPTVKISA